MGVAMPLFHARGVFQYSFGLIPYRKPIHTVGMKSLVFYQQEVVSSVSSTHSVSVGKPIAVVQTPSPSSEDIEMLHRLYMQNLTELFEQHKRNYGVSDEQHLTFI